MFVLFEGLGSPIYPDDFQDVEVKDEPLEPDTVSCEHMQDIFIFKAVVWLLSLWNFIPCHIIVLCLILT